ncbi:hypothetical protein Tco_0018074 [Tanacetum coccineum]
MIDFMKHDIFKEQQILCDCDKSTKLPMTICANTAAKDVNKMTAQVHFVCWSIWYARGLSFGSAVSFAAAYENTGGYLDFVPLLLLCTDVQSGKGTLESRKVPILLSVRTLQDPHQDTSLCFQGVLYHEINNTWKSLPTSTMMAEYVACYHATSHAILLRNLISGLKVVDSISRPIRLYYDNSSVVRFLNNTSSTGAGLYLETKYLYVREKVEDNSIAIEYISIHDMLADSLTKGLPPKLFLEHVAGMGLCDSQI